MSEVKPIWPEILLIEDDITTAKAVYNFIYNTISGFCHHVRPSNLRRRETVRSILQENLFNEDLIIFGHTASSPQEKHIATLDTLCRESGHDVEYIVYTDSNSPDLPQEKIIIRSNHHTGLYLRVIELLSPKFLPYKPNN